MSIPGKVLVALLTALLASVATTLVSPELSLSILFTPTAAAAIAAVILSHRALPMPSGLAASAATETKAKKDKAPRKQRNKGSQSKDLETGVVKWFNGTKGFGFIVRDNGEEIFVHHRSIVGEGRRNLKDGATVRFRVVTTDKGPQAEDVESAD